MCVWVSNINIYIAAQNASTCFNAAGETLDVASYSVPAQLPQPSHARNTLEEYTWNALEEYTRNTLDEYTGNTLGIHRRNALGIHWRSTSEYNGGIHQKYTRNALEEYTGIHQEYTRGIH